MYPRYDDISKSSDKVLIRKWNIILGSVDVLVLVASAIDET